MIYRIGITGPIGSGKSTVAHMIAEMGIPVIDTDIIARQIVEKGSPVLETLSVRFGNSILNIDGSLNRGRLAEVAFLNAESATALNSITHPAILKKVQELINTYQNNGKKYVAIEATLLFESNADTLCNAVISVIAPREIRLGRVIRRDKMDVKNIEKRMAAQQDESYYTSKSRFVVVNDKNDHTELKKQIEKIISEIFKEYCSNEETIG